MSFLLNRIHRSLPPLPAIAPFNSAQYAKAQESFLKKKELEDIKAGIKPQAGRGGGGGGGGRWANMAGSRTQWQGLVNRLKKDGLLPCVVFNFSKKKCEECADFLRSEDLNAARERSAVHVFATGAIKRLQEKDRKLPQVIFLPFFSSRGGGGEGCLWARYGDPSVCLSRVWVVGTVFGCSFSHTHIHRKKNI